MIVLLILIILLCNTIHSMNNTYAMREKKNKSLLELAHIDPELVFDYAVRQENICSINTLICAKVNIPSAYKIGVLEIAIKWDYSDTPIQGLETPFPNLLFQIVNPIQRPHAQKNIETLLAIYNQQCPNISELPKDLIKIITTYAYPEYAIDAHIIASIDPAILVDTVPVETLAVLIKNNMLSRDVILHAWKHKLATIAQELTKSGKVYDNQIKSFEKKILHTIEALF